MLTLSPKNGTGGELSRFPGAGRRPQTLWLAAQEISHCVGRVAEVKSGQLKGSDERSAMSTKMKTIVIFVIAIVLAAVVLPLAGIFVFPHLSGHDLLLRYLSTIASWSWWPIALIILFIFFCLLFRPQVSRLIEALKDIDLLKAKATFAQQPPALQPPAPSPDVKDLEATKSRIQELERLLFFERTAKVMFRSQLELLWEMASRGSVTNDFTYEWYRTHFRGNVPLTPYGAYIEFLKASLLITSDPLDMHLTPIGNKFLEFMRLYPIHLLLPF